MFENQSKRSRVVGWRGVMVALVGTIGLACANAANRGAAQGASRPQGDTMKLRITIDGTVLTATLEDNATAKDFASLLPLTLTLKDYAATEKISDLPKKLSITDAPAGYDPSIGDIAYYSPWGNLAVYYEDFGYSSGLVKLGKLDAGIEVLKRPGPLTAKLELVNE